MLFEQLSYQRKLITSSHLLDPYIYAIGYMLHSSFLIHSFRHAFIYVIHFQLN